MFIDCSHYIAQMLWVAGKKQRLYAGYTTCAVVTVLM